MSTLPTWTIILIVLMLASYFVGVSYIGKRGAPYSKTMAGFATARGKVSPWLVGASFAATFASANLYLGLPGLAYQYGISVLWYTLGSFGTAWLGLLLFAKTFWKYQKEKGGVSTLPEWLGKRYNSKTLQILVSILLLFNIYYIVGQNVGLATIFETIIGIPYEWGVVAGVMITIIYIGLGGAFAQIITDAFQGILMSVTSVLIIVSLFWTIGGGFQVFDRMFDQLAAIHPALVSTFSAEGPYDSVPTVLAIQFLMISFVLMPHLLNKILAIETEKELRPFVISSGVHLFFISYLPVFGGFAARILVPGLTEADQALPAYLIEAFPPFIVALMIVGVISAVLSSTDSLYLSITSSIGNDIYLPLVQKTRTKASTINHDHRAVTIAKFSLLLIGATSLYLSINRPESLAMLIQFSFSAIISGVFGPVLLGYFWRKGNQTGAIVSVLTGSLSYLAFTQFNLLPNLYIALFVSSALGFVSMIGASYLSTAAGTKVKVFGKHSA
ncbi:sodium:solute symporter family protein [Sediminibacillus halophilus]|uniref:Sodium/proline symporter n=1 Tax=Sediminibacillus halophilus TaxID=482461 RepID=A0A1G9RXX3_9BACI|nr:sodium:solute symporter family protein [Sediminibacillus halophilus]SDM28138.1 sodium/proline symporter [Sediminibacillus halophilus]